MFGFKQKKEDSSEKIDLLNDIQSKWDEPLPFQALDVPDAQPQQTAEVEKIQEPQEIPDAEISRTEPTQSGVDRTAIEELSKKIEDENKTINRKFKLFTKNQNQLTLESQELIDLIKLYANTNGKFSEFIEEMHNLERQGWNFDLSIAAFYKFRVGKALADMKRQATNVEKICRKVGFTPSNIKAILKSPIEDLVKSLSERTIEIKKSKK